MNNPLIIPLNQALAHEAIACGRPREASAYHQNNYFESSPQ